MSSEWLRITRRLAACAVLAIVCACGASEREIRDARTSGYNTDFAIVYSETLNVVRGLYPQLKENASSGLIQTAWHPVRIQQEGTDDTTSPTTGQGTINTTGPNASQFGGGTSVRRTRFFIRFDVHVIGGKPWRVRVHGQASKWRAGEIPTPLRGAEVPHWLVGREDAMRVEIHKKLQKHAVKLKFKKKKPPPREKLDTTQFASLPPRLAKRIAEVRRAAAARDTTSLRKFMAEDFSWSFGSGGGADTAVAMWLADSSILSQMVDVLDKGCKMDDQRQLVTCPPEYTQDPAYLGYRAGFAAVDGKWRMTFFVEGD